MVVGRKLLSIMRAMSAGSPAELLISMHKTKIVEIFGRFEYNHGRQDQQWGVFRFDKVDVGWERY